MMYDYSPTYNNRGFTRGFEENKSYYVSFVNNEKKLETIEVYVEAVYSESSPHRTRWYVKLMLPTNYYKTFLHKWAGFKSIDYKKLNEYINEEFVKETPLEAEIAYLNIMKQAHNGIIETLNVLHDEFGDKHPDLYLTKVIPYKGLKLSRPPHYESHMNGTERESFQSYSRP